MTRRGSEVQILYRPHVNMQVRAGFPGPDSRSEGSRNAVVPRDPWSRPRRAGQPPRPFSGGGAGSGRRGERTLGDRPWSRRRWPRSRPGRLRPGEVPAGLRGEEPEEGPLRAAVALTKSVQGIEVGEHPGGRALRRRPRPSFAPVEWLEPQPQQLFARLNGQHVERRLRLAASSSKAPDTRTRNSRSAS